MEIKKETCYHVQCLGKWVHNSKPTQGRTTRRRGGPRGSRGSRAAGLRGTGRVRGRRGARRRGQPGCVKRAARARTKRRAAAEAGAAWSGGGGGSRAAATAGDDLEGRLHGPCGEDAEVRGSAGEEEGGRGRRRRRTRAGLLGDLKNMAKGVICWAGDGSVSAG